MKNHWQTKKVGDCLQRIPSIGSVLSSHNLEKGKFPIIDQGQNFIAGYTNDESLVFSNCLPVIIFGDHTRILKFIDFPFAVGADGTKILKPIEDFDPKFFYYMIQSIDLGSRGYARHFKLLKESEIPLPPLEIQKNIVAKLDEKFAKLREAKKLREEALADTEKILFQTIGEILDSINSELTNLGDISKMVSGGTPSRSNLQYWGGNLPWVSSGELNNIYIFETKEKISENGLKNSNTKLLPVNTLLIGMYDTAALKMSICKKEITTNQAIIGLLPNSNKFISEFIYYQLTYLRPEIMKIRQGVRQKNLNSKMIKNIKIKLPSISDQQKIVIKLNNLSEKIKSLRELQKSQLEDLKLLEKAYLREAFRGELN